MASYAMRALSLIRFVLVKAFARYWLPLLNGTLRSDLSRFESLALFCEVFWANDLGFVPGCVAAPCWSVASFGSKGDP